MYDVTMTSFLCFHQRKCLKAIKRHNDVIMMLNCKFMLVFELSGPNIVVSTPNFSSISLQMADFHFSLEPNPARYLL